MSNGKRYCVRTVLCEIKGEVPTHNDQGQRVMAKQIVPVAIGCPVDEGVTIMPSFHAQRWAPLIKPDGHAMRLGKFDPADLLGAVIEGVIPR